MGFRDRILEFERRNIRILGVSTDAVEDNAAFAEKFDFPFPLLSDPEGEVCRAYEACSDPDLPLAARITYVIDPRGRIAQVHHQKIDNYQHAESLLAAACGVHERKFEMRTEVPHEFPIPPPAESPPPAIAPQAPRVHPAGCSGSASKVYALGQIAYDFGSDARRDALVQAGLDTPHDPGALLAFLDEHPTAATAIHWLLVQEATPIYALRGAGPYAAEVFSALREFLGDQQTDGVEQVSIPGEVSGSVTLGSGQTVPILWAETRGMYSWSTEALVRAILAGGAGEDSPTLRQEIHNFLDRVYYEVRNLGLAPQERALNFAATHAFRLESIYAAAIEQGLRLDTMGVERSPICRPNSDCWDVKLTFFDPARRLERARDIYRLTADVGDRVPVSVGRVRHWQVY